MPMMAVGPNGQEFEVIDLPESAVGGMEGGQQPRAMAMERKGPEFLSSNPQMQILTCFGHCGAECMVSLLKPATGFMPASYGQSAQSTLTSDIYS